MDSISGNLGYIQHRHAMVALWTMGRASSHNLLLTALAHERSLSVYPWPLEREGATAMPARQGRWWLTQDSEQVVIHATPHHIYALIADLPRMGEWSPECERVEWEGGATGPAEGARFVGHNRGGPFQWFRWSRHGRVLTADPGREFAFVTEEGGRESTVWRYQFAPVHDGTLVTESYEVRWLPAWARLIDVPANRHRELQEAMRHTLGKLKTAAEAATDPAGPP